MARLGVAATDHLEWFRASKFRQSLTGKYGLKESHPERQVPRLRENMEYQWKTAS